MESKKTKAFRILFLILSIAAIAACCFLCAYLIWEKAPGDQSGNGVYTLFISGIDEQNYSTEVNMLIKYDTAEKKIDIVPYPKDTLLNIDFQVRKMESVYYGAVRNGIEPWSAVSKQLEKLLGFEPDGYAFIPKTVFNDFLTDGKINDITTFFSVLNSATDTSLSASNIAFLTRQSVNITPEDVTYHAFPSESMTIRGYSYEVIKLSDWISLLNSRLNTTGETVQSENLDIVYLDDGSFAATKELLGAWYYDNIDEELNEGGNSDEEALPSY